MRHISSTKKKEMLRGKRTSLGARLFNPIMQTFTHSVSSPDTLFSLKKYKRKEESGGRAGKREEGGGGGNGG